MQEEEQEEELPADGAEESCFTEAYLTNLTASDMYQLCSTLQEAANKEGFELSCVDSKTRRWNQLYCTQFGAADEDGRKRSCPFSISISLSETNRGAHVTKYRLEHCHELNPLLFAHRFLDTATKSILMALAEMRCTPGQLAIWLRKNKGVSLSTKQVRALVHSRDPSVGRLTETVELQRYMNTIQGLSYVMEEEWEGKRMRTAIATFTKDELRNLEDFGDVIAIDPTFLPLNLNWNVIPLTVVGRGREIRSAGLIMSVSTVENVFKWILTLLVDVLPCKDILKSIVSDDDHGLRAAFANASNPKITGLGRIVCFWHKMQTFSNLLKKCHLNRDDMKTKMEIFRRIGMTRDRSECLRLIDNLRQESPEFIRRFLVDFEINNLALSTKSHNRAWSLGYITSSIAEASNSRLKTHTSPRNQSLTELRQNANDVEDQARVNEQYLKSAKHYKMKDPQVQIFMDNYLVSRRIAEALAGSYNKASRLTVTEMESENQFRVEEPAAFGESSEFVVDADADSCSCWKKETVGIPCSHLICVLMKLGQLDRLAELIDRRWTSDAITNAEVEIEFHSIPDSVPVDPAMSPSTPRQRYVRLFGMCQSIASLAGKTERTYEMALGDLQGLLSRLERPGGEECDCGDEVMDARGNRAGRPSMKRIRTESTGQQSSVPSSNAGHSHGCEICDGDHSPKNCPHHQEMMSFVTDADRTANGARNCSGCGLKGHYISKCPVISRFRASKENERGEV
jgi:hypothetical protein